MAGQRQTRGLAFLAPLATAGLLVALMATGGVEAITTEQTEAYHAQVRELVDEIPYRIGDWVGTDVEAPPAAVKLLKPNALLQRRFVDPGTGRSFSLLVVHSGDVGDMEGHWPPICYPAHGWVLESEKETAIQVGAVRIPAREYYFRRVVDGFEQTMNVIGFFVVPNGSAEIVSSYAALKGAARRRSLAGLGAAQIQLVGGGDLSASERRRIAEEFVQAIEPLIREIAGGVDGG